MKRIVCLSGGEASALVAVEVSRRFGIQGLVLLNHDINATVEDADIKRFKQAIADYCGVPLTFANMPGWDIKDQFDVVVEAGAFKVGTGTALCTNRMKTAPFETWLAKNATPGVDCICYGFSGEKAELKRVLRRSSHLGILGFETDFPLAFWTRTILSTREIGIEPPLTYARFRHANCTGCLKAGMQHWYVVYCTRPDIWEKAIWAEDEIGYTIIKGHPLASLEFKFELMKTAGVEASEGLPAATFWAQVRKRLASFEAQEELPEMPCECAM